MNQKKNETDGIVPKVFFFGEVFFKSFFVFISTVTKNVYFRDFFTLEVRGSFF